MEPKRVFEQFNASNFGSSELIVRTKWSVLLPGWFLLAVLLLAATGYGNNHDNLPEGEGKYRVMGFCTICHSIRIVVQQGLNRNSWTEVLETMVEEHEMPQLPPEELEIIIDYLTRFYGPDRAAMSQE